MRATFRNLYDQFNMAAFVRDCHGHAVSVLRWALILVPMAATVGLLCAAFLWSLDAVTRLRFAYPWLLYLLPIGGFVVGLIYHLTGRSVEGGNNLIVEQIHEPGGGVPLRMAPLIFFGTVVTHLFGGSAGREGTAVQLGGSLASGFGRAFRLDAEATRILLMTGIAAGFGAVFGTPIAGAVFALEVLAIGRVKYRALVPCLVAALVGGLPLRPPRQRVVQYFGAPYQLFQHPFKMGDNLSDQERVAGAAQTSADPGQDRDIGCELLEFAEHASRWFVLRSVPGHFAFSFSAAASSFSRSLPT